MPGSTSACVAVIRIPVGDTSVFSPHSSPARCCHDVERVALFQLAIEKNLDEDASGRVEHHSEEHLHRREVGVTAGQFERNGLVLSDHVVVLIDKAGLLRPRAGTIAPFVDDAQRRMLRRELRHRDLLEQTEQDQLAVILAPHLIA